MIEELATTPDVELSQAVAECERIYRTNRPNSASQARKAATVMPGGNTRSSLWYDPFPLCVVSGTDARLRDIDGREYLDFLGEFTSGIAGHSPTLLKDAIKAALDRGINLSSHNDIESELAAAIVRRIPSMELVRFTNSGTEANIMALMTARTATGREKILVFEGGYHGSGLTIGATADRGNLPFDLVVARYNDLASARTLAELHAADLAAIIVEPMLGAGGCIPGQVDFLHGLRELADQVGALLILDEVQTSRLAPGGRQSQIGLVPDLTTIGKFYGGGLAFGCFGGRADIMALLDPRNGRGLVHSGTFNNNTLVMSAGLAAVTHILTADALATLNDRGERLRTAMNALFATTAAPFTATGIGSLMNIHSTISGETGAMLRRLIFFEMLEHGIYFAPRGLIALSLPLTDSDVDRFITHLTDVLDRHTRLFERL